ncbi:hypothetical protein EZS27_026424, partial [termite gut metagenome]
GFAFIPLMTSYYAILNLVGTLTLWTIHAFYGKGNKTILN